MSKNFEDDLARSLALTCTPIKALKFQCQGSARLLPKSIPSVVLAGLATKENNQNCPSPLPGHPFPLPPEGLGCYHNVYTCKILHPLLWSKQAGAQPPSFTELSQSLAWACMRLQVGTSMPASTVLKFLPFHYPSIPANAARVILFLGRGTCMGVHLCLPEAQHGDEPAGRSMTLAGSMPAWACRRLRAHFVTLSAF